LIPLLHPPPFSRLAFRLPFVSFCALAFFSDERSVIFGGALHVVEQSDHEKNADAQHVHKLHQMLVEMLGIHRGAMQQSHRQQGGGGAEREPASVWVC
jgi:hypothetical protein